MKNRQFMKMYLQMFTDDYVKEGNIRIYEKKFTKLLRAIFQKTAPFMDFLAGRTYQMLDGVSERDTAFFVKTTNIPSVIREGTLGEDGQPAYNTGANIAFGSGTGSSSRFGPRTEIISEEEKVDYTWDWCFHEGVDRHTVNNSFDEVVAERLLMHAKEKSAMMSRHIGKFISDNAKKTIYAGSLTTTTVKKIFSEASIYFKNIGLIDGVTLKAKVTAEVYDLLEEADLLTTAKNADINIADDIVRKYKRFEIEAVEDAAFQEGEVAMFYVEGIGTAFMGINTVRTLPSEDFDGQAIQGAGKAGEWCPEANKAAMAKAKIGTAPQT